MTTSLSYSAQLDRAKRLETDVRAYDAPDHVLLQATEIVNDETEVITWRLHAAYLAVLAAAKLDNGDLAQHFFNILSDKLEGKGEDV